MYHGIVSAENAYYGLEGANGQRLCRSGLELLRDRHPAAGAVYYPSMLNKVKWDTLAKAAKWSKENASVLVDTHWIGGDLTALAVYGWASEQRQSHSRFAQPIG